MMLREQSPSSDIVNASDMEYHLRRSFSKGDKNYQARFWFARQLMLRGQWREAMQYYRILRKLTIPYKQRKRPEGAVRNDDGSNKEYYGKITELYPSGGMIMCDEPKIKVYLSNDNNSLDDRRSNERVKFEMAFNYFGPIALSVKIVER
jgi:hypothetical protein